VLGGEAAGGETFLGASHDPFIVYGAIPGSPEKTARSLAMRAMAFETGAWLMLLLGIALNGFLLMLLLLGLPR